MQTQKQKKFRRWLINKFDFLISMLKKSAELHKKENKKKRNREIKIKTNDQSRRRNAFWN